MPDPPSALSVFANASVSFRLMDIVPIGAGGLGVVVGLSILVQLAWHVAVLVFVYKIWQKVKHLPS